MGTYPYTVCLGPLTPRKKAMYKKGVSFGSMGDSRPEFYNTDGATNGNRNRRYDPRSRASDKSQKSTGMQRLLPAGLLPQRCYYEVENFPGKERPKV